MFSIRRKYVLILTLVPALMVFGVFLYLNSGFVSGISPEELVERIKSEPERTERYELTRVLVERVGPSEAVTLLGRIRQGELQDLYLAEMHLLMHVVGEEAYKRYGYKALFLCEGDMQNGCMHGVFMGAINEYGLDGITSIMELCKNEPPHKYKVWCLHGAGHTFLAMTDYRDLSWALEQCDLLDGRDRKGFENCYQGVFMENVYGEHNGLKATDRAWLNKDDLLMPCDKIVDRYRNQCYFIQPGWWYLALKDMAQTAKLCDKVPKENLSACAGGVGMMMHTINKTEDPKVMVADCRRHFEIDSLTDDCLNTISRGIFTYHDHELAALFCHETLTVEGKTVCYKHIGERMTEYEFSEDKIAEVCEKFEPGFSHLC